MAVPIEAAIVLGIAVSLSMIAFLIYSQQSSVAESLALKVSEGQKTLAERVGRVYWDPVSCELWISNDGSCPVTIKEIYVDGALSWSGEKELEVGEVWHVSLSCGRAAAIVTDRGIQVVRRGVK